MCADGYRSGNLRVLMIPSWYPNHANPLEGGFIADQARAILDLHPEVELLVSTWGHSSGRLFVRDPGGVARSILWRVRVASTGMDSVLDRGEVHNPSLTWSARIPGGGLPQLVSINREVLLRVRRDIGELDLIHAHVCYPAGFVASVLSREFGIPYLLTEHMGPFPFPDMMRHGAPIPEIRAAFSGAVARVAVSPFLARQIEDMGLGRCEVVPNLADERRFFPGEGRVGRFTFLALAPMTHPKGVEVLVRAIAKWRPSGDAVEFKIGGTGPMLGRYQALARDLGIEHLITWLGPVRRDDAPSLFRSCSAFVLPSLHESFGVVAIEALASGKPVIASRCGGPESVVTPANGYLVDPGDINALAAALHRMTVEIDSYEPAEIRRDFMLRFSRPAVGGQIVRLYESLM
jgi:glycosyltransferase involved in cell wall biosynthesis